MINNRQNGRRRGRGGGPRSPNNLPSPGNRQENRSRGNAVQLHEKYKALARDTQLAGDRIQTEYYLQFADHYFRIMNENRVRYEDQRRQRDDYSSDEEEYRDENVVVAGENEPGEGENPLSEDRSAREFHFERDQNSGADRDRRPRNRGGRNDARRETSRGESERHSQDRDDDGDIGEERISLDSLPPAIATVASEEAPAAPRRRTRRPRGDAGDADVAPVA